jgi:hypothetical protein
LKNQNKELLALSISSFRTPVGRDAAGLLLQSGGTPLAWKVIRGKDSARTNALLTSISGVGSKESIDMLRV